MINRKLAELHGINKPASSFSADVGAQNRDDFVVAKMTNPAVTNRLMRNPAVPNRAMTNPTSKSSLPNQSAGHPSKIVPERRRSLRHRMNAPVFAIFDGVSGGMILDLSEEGLAMLSPIALDADRAVPLSLHLTEPALRFDASGYIAWADTFGRAGIRFSELPADARERLRHWLTVNAAKTISKTPKYSFEDSGLYRRQENSSASPDHELRSIDFIEKDEDNSGAGASQNSSPTIQFEFSALAKDLDTALHLIAERAQSLTRGTGAALAVLSGDSIVCRARTGSGAPPLGSTIDISTGFSGGCIRTGQTLRCDDAESDPRVYAAACQQLAIRSIVAAPIHYERQVVGLLEVFCSQPSAFDEGDVAVVERLAHTALLTLTQNAALRRPPSRA